MFIIISIIQILLIDNQWDLCILDFHSLDKSYLFTLNIAATQELDRQLQDVKEENNQLRNIISNLENRLTTLEISKIYVTYILI